MAALSDFLENALVDHVFRGISYTMPSTIYIGLFTAAPSDSGGGTEVTGGSYARVQVGPSAGAWKSTNGATSGASSGTGGQTMNAAAITFPTPTASWGQATHFAAFDASTGGNMLFHGALTLPKTINNGDPAPSFAADQLVVTLG